MYTGASDAPSDICSAIVFGRGLIERRDRAPRICFLGVATSVISVFTALILIQIEMVVFCAPGFVSIGMLHDVYACSNHSNNLQLTGNYLLYFQSF